MRILGLLGVLLCAMLSVTVPASAEQTTAVERDAGCPATLPVIQAANANFVYLDRTALSKSCLRKLYEQNGDDKGQGGPGEGK